MEAVFECTLLMITRNMEDFPEHRIKFFQFLQVTNHKEMSSEKFPRSSLRPCKLCAVKLKFDNALLCAFMLIATRSLLSTLCTHSVEVRRKAACVPVATATATVALLH
jgi:CRM1 C terminal